MAKKNSKESKAPASVQNRRARYDYMILEDVEAGIVLQGSEVKSLYLGKANLTDSYCRVINGEMFLFQMDIEPYDKASIFAHERRRDRKLLMNRREINVYERKSLEKGLTIIPLGVYFNDRGKAKIRIGLGRGKASHDKRDSIAKNETRREMDRVRKGDY